MLGLAASLKKGGASLLTFVKDNLKLYLDFKSNKSDTLKFPSEGSTSFDGNDHISIADSSTLTIADGQGFTASIWFKTSTATEMYLFDNRSGSEGFTAIINAGGTNYLGHIHDGSNALQFTNTENYNDGAWHHFAFTFDGTDTITSYIDGSSVGTGTQALGEVNGGNLLIGKPTASDTKYWNGSLTNFAIWSRELTPEEVQSIKNKSYSQLKGVEKTSLVAWWALDADSLSEQVFTDTTWATQGSSQTATHNGNFNFTVTNDGTGTQSYRPSIDFPTTAGKTYKMTLTPTSKTGTINALFHNGFNTGGGYQGDFSFDGNSTIVYYYTGFNGGFLSLNGTTGAWSITFDILVQETNYQLDSKGTNHGSTFGATINSNVYGGNAPILPRAVDVAKEGQADNIGNGSASFDGDTDYVEFGTDVYDFSSGDFTLTAWIYHDTANTDHAGIFGVRLNDGNSSNTEVQLYIDKTNDTLASWNGSSNVNSTSAIPDKEWTHVALVQSGSNKKFYINGILDNTVSQGNGNQTNTATFKIGWTGSAIAENFLGNISQAGIWAGELSQSQLQSVLESTSYSKIPADVKSTLGSELFDADASTFDSGTHSWVVYGSNTVANDSGALKITYVNDARGAYLWLKDASDLSSNLTIGKTYKFTFDAKVSSGASVDVTISTLSGSPQVITETSFTTKSIYFTAENTTTTYIDTRNMGSGEIIYLDNLSLKEVINDIVAYYPLDGDSSRGNGTDDVTTGEVLGSELFTNGWTNDGNGSSYPPYSGSFSYDASANTVTATSGSSGTFVGNETFRTEFTAVANALYKITFTTSNTVSSVQLRGLSSANHLDTQASTPYLAQSSLGDGNQVFYLKANASATRYIGFRSGGTNRSITVSNFSIKQVTSNTGVLL